MSDILEEKLINENYITENELKEIKKLMNLKDYTNFTFEDILIKENYIEEEELIEILHTIFDIPIINLEESKIDYKLLKLFSEEFLRKNNVIPLKISKKNIEIAMQDPTEIVIIDDIEKMTGLKVKVFLATSNQILKLINKIYDKDYNYKEKIFSEINKNTKLVNENDEINEIVQEAPIVKLANMILKEAVDNKASDIHIEPEDKKVRIRFRIDGILTTKMVLPYQSINALISRIKIISDLDITENRLPQDGRIEKELDGEKIDMRVSTIPTIHGEKAVIRLLKKESSLININSIGFSKENLKIFKKLIKKQKGIILLTGPTGSGKSTTLFAALNRLKSDSKNIITIEDPVEYQIPGINQIQLNKKINFDFPNALKSILRQDPDIIMVGEIRDKKTASIAIRAALTGHLVLSTLHTNDAVSSIVRLIDMGIPSYLVAASVKGVVAQRLVRRICENCKQEYSLNEEDKKFFSHFGNINKFYKGNKCNECHSTGYKGRIAIHEILLIDNQIQKMIGKGVNENNIKNYLKEKGNKFLIEDGFKKAKIGVTSLEEIIRVLELE
ncbi:MAG: GspE/PulE family protein [Bacillota bacterium]